MTVSDSLFLAHTPYDILLYTPYIAVTISIVVVAALFNKKLTSLLHMIPDYMCMIIFVLFFIAYLIKCAVFISKFNDLENLHPGTDNVTRALIDAIIFLIIFIIVIVLLLLSYSKNKLQYNRLLELEKELQYKYYNSVSQIYKDIRNLKHDLANHLAAIDLIGATDRSKQKRYEQTLLHICDNIDSRTKQQTNWQILDTDLLSNREKYEIYQYIESLLLKLNISVNDLEVDSTKTMGLTMISLTFPSYCSKKLSIFRLKRNTLYKLIALIAGEHKGSADWKKDTNSCVFCLKLRQAL